ncbi:MAG: hypothetical protein D6714_15520 [Bacteroidetes bacterium]|nr:MAG: hypothetical protein D6714_15520 [Bacteroidota bacterium]
MIFFRPDLRPRKPRPAFRGRAFCGKPALSGTFFAKKIIAPYGRFLPASPLIALLFARYF